MNDPNYIIYRNVAKECKADNTDKETESEFTSDRLKQAERDSESTETKGNE